MLPCSIKFLQLSKTTKTHVGSYEESVHKQVGGEIKVPAKKQEEGNSD